MAEHRNGKVVTFYSFKGGTGRTMALANVAWILAANGKRVLAVDWDLESPGLHRFFEPFLDAGAIETSGGVIDMIRAYEWATTRPGEREPDWHEDFARVHKHAFSLNWKAFPAGGQLDFLSAGLQNQDYAANLTGMNWDDFYERRGGGRFFAALRADMQANYDYTLIDSRTGLSDVADICTIDLPSVLVDCFTLSEQGITGAARVATKITQEHAKRNIRILPVPMRVDPAEKERADAGLRIAMQRFPELPADMTPSGRSQYWNEVEVPYRAFYAYEEILATFGDRPGQSGSMLAAYEKLAQHITDGAVTALPPMDDAVRTRVVSRFVRRVEFAEEEVVLHYSPEDQLWAEWIRGLLVAAGIRVRGPQNPVPESRVDTARHLTILSHANAGAQDGIVQRDLSDPRPPLAVYVEDMTPLSSFPMNCSAFIGGKSFATAIERVLRLVGRTAPEDIDQFVTGVRFPGEQPAIFNPLARNARFTGREDDLLDLRSQLSGGTAVVLSGPTPVPQMPVALQGMGGIGKTQVALEYAHRFRSAYDVVWWVDAEQAQFIDSILADLGRRLNLSLPQSGVQEEAKAVIAALEQGDPHARWLLVFDNAEDVPKVLSFVPKGPGHVLITSRNSQWGDRAQTMQIDVFKRRESVAHLRQRINTIRPEEADRVADVLGDLPIAVAAAGAMLAETGLSVQEYLQTIERQGPGSTVDEVWNLSLDLLRERSRGAYRLLQLCSVLAPEISLDLIYSDELAQELREYDPLVTERAYRGSLVQHINRLALLKLDVGRKQIQVHRLLQHVVRSRMSEQELRVTRHQIHLVLAKLRPEHEIDDPRSWPRFRVLWPHLEISNATDCDDTSVRQLMIDRIRYIWVTGGSVEGRQLGEQIADRWQTMLTAMTNPADVVALRTQLLHLRFNIAIIMRSTAQFDEALELNEAVLAAQTELLGENHPHTLMTAGSLGGDLRALGRYREALERDQKTYAAWVEHFGDDYTRTHTALSNLATTHRLAGNFREARALDQGLWDRRRDIIGPTHPNTLGTGTNLGRDLREAGDYKTSSELLEQIARQYEEVFGSNNYRTLAARANLAVSVGSHGQTDRAARMLEDAYEQLNEVVGPDNPDTLACRLSRALSLLAIGEVRSATTELAEVHEAYSKQLGHRHPHSLLCLTNRAMTARVGGDLAVAKEYAKRAATDLEKILGPDHPYSLAAALNLAIVHAEEGDLREGLRLIDASLNRHLTVLGTDHPDYLRCTANQVLMIAANGERPTGADDVLERLTATLGDKHPAVTTFLDGHYLHRVLDPHPF
ncbi:FxSxx-COOH system tetratricopeptide repeat protein [Actinoplanes sp. NBRC 101535]|uniref:FxSxx-COOH system tetratricopeptide repeat protein n=1 Tax=Actinoplanes sp. NBRC 101535 TaxID=3032196 RepID=UPI0024A062E8|nr:FxSxx-COOH system tetratricopeptide repeat protein [Actinoplanes sp. NBRC 101535]GLY00193.1 hypothetical protein Acsp01_05720 [Actinoplanes sp. NBRC 101535]